MLNCPSIATRNACGAIHKSRYKAGRSGYTGAPQVLGLVLHFLHGMDEGTYNNQITTPVPSFHCDPNDPCRFLHTRYPKSVHFLVTPTATIQYAEITDTTFGIDYLLGTNFPLPQIITDVNGPWIHIAITSLDLTSTLINLLCCIQVTLGYPVPILTSGDLQADRPLFILDPSLETLVNACIAKGGVEEAPTIGDIEKCCEENQACCEDNTADILVLQQKVSQLTGRVVVLEGKVNVLQAQMANQIELTAIIPTLLAQIQILTSQVTDILTRCCPQPKDAVCFNYQLLPGDEMLITPNQSVWLNLPTRIEDRDDPNCNNNCLGPIVTPGPLWSANLCDCNWKLEASVRFRLSNWCAGKKVRLYLVACGVKYLIAEQAIASSSLQQVTLSGEFILNTPPCCSDVHLLVFTNDDNTTSGKVVEFASFTGCCL